ncbi:MAG: ferrous iron transport protein B [Elusimicrobia bacterium]|nr:ferrous iron transport protein B [Elusimicrobiota bacterium]
MHNHTLFQESEREHKKIAHKQIVLIGHPNVGKSVLFNVLTGRYVTVSNYPGTTVDVSRGVGSLGGEVLEIVDSPGIHSLVAYSEEERVTRALLLGRPEVLVHVADAKNLSRELLLTLELAELKIPMVLCLNMKDEALSRGYWVDAKRLSQILGIPVAQTVATTQEGLEELKGAILKASPPSWKAQYPLEIQKALREITDEASEEVKLLGPLLLQNHVTPEELAISRVFIPPQILVRIQGTQKKFIRPVSAILMQTRQEEASHIVAEVLSKPSPGRSTGLSRFLEALGRWSLRPWPGYFLGALVLWALYEFVGVLGAQICVNFLEKTLFGEYVTPWVTLGVRALVPTVFLQDLLVGPYGIFSMALTYAFALILPIVTTFFLALGILEDVGYLPRLSVLLNRFFHLMGLNGKAVFPMILGLGCGTMAMLTTRILDSKKERVLASFLLALAIPCSAQLGVILGMTSGLAPSVLGIWLGVVMGSLLGVGWLASRILPGAPSPFLLELPPLRLPQMSNLFRKVWTRLKWYLREVVPLFIYGTMALYLLDRMGWLQIIEKGFSPVVKGFLGLPEKSAEAFLIGFLRRDYGAAGFYQMQKQGLLTLRQSTVAIVAITLFMPCIAQWFMSLRERGWKATMVITAAVLSYALLISGGINQMLLALGWS